MDLKYLIEKPETNIINQDFLNETILIGQNNGSIYELPLSKAQTG